MAREVKIVVKNVYAPTEQQQFIVAETALVRELKLLVHAQFPGAPLPAHQKLIFGGKVCADSDALLTILSVMRSDERAEDAAAVVFHLLVSGSPPRSRPSTPPVATTPAPASVASSTSVASAAQEAIDSPRPVAPAFSFDGSAGAVGAREQAPQSAAAFAFPGLNASFASPSTPVPVSVSGPGTAPLPQDLLTQGVLMHQQAMLLAQIQYLQYLRAHAQQTQTQTQAPPVAQAPHPYAHQFGYLGMHHHAHMLHAMHGLQQHPHNGHHGHAAAPAGVVEPPVTPVQRVPLVGQIAREILPLFDLRLAMKMAFMLFIIGQDTPNDRVLMLAFLSFVSYLHITGILAKIYDVYKRYYTPAPDANGAANPAAAGDAVDALNGARANGVAAGLARLDFARVLRISSDRGLVQDVKYFVVGFLLSLVPAWHPQPLQGTPAAQAAVQDLPDVAEMPVQGI